MITVTNPRGDVAVTVPTKPDGTHYRFEMIYDGDARRAYADTPIDLCGALIHGYADLDFGDTAEADAARLAHAGRIQVELQAQLNAAGKTTDLDQATRTVLTAPRHVAPDPGASWDADIPLVLLTVDHAPYTDTPVPTGNVIWLDPTTETDLLESLAQADVIVLAEANNPTS